MEKELPDNWDAMSYMERDNLLSEIDKNFYEKFRRVYTAKYTDRNLDDKAKIGHRFFRTFRHKLVTRAKQEILLDVSDVWMTTARRILNTLDNLRVF